MIETIVISKLTKSYINNHAVLCGGVHCKYQETINGYTGEHKNEYVVLNALLDIRFTKLSDLKDYIRTSGEPRNIIGSAGVVLNYDCIINGLRVYTHDNPKNSSIYIEGYFYMKFDDMCDVEDHIDEMKTKPLSVMIPPTTKLIDRN